MPGTYTACDVTAVVSDCGQMSQRKPLVTSLDAACSEHASAASGLVIFCFCVRHRAGRGGR